MTRADQRKFHYIYKITRNDGSGKYYIGMHSTDDLEDGYFGSGQLLWKSIKKYGRDIHSMEILEFLPSRRELKTRERELVNEEIVNDPLCMNLKLGGEGGGKFWSEEHQRKCAQAAANKRKGVELSSAWRANISASMIGTANFKHSPRFTGKICSESHRAKIAEKNKTMVGEKNSQFGTCWVTNGMPIKIKLEQLNEYLAKGYRRGRKYGE